MNIDGKNSVVGFKKNPINVGKYNSKANTSFKGHILTEDNKGNPVYKFFLPNAPKGVKLQLAVLSKDNNGDYSVVQKFDSKSMPEGFKSLYIKAKDYGIDENNLLGYKFIWDNADYTDKGILSKEFYNIAVPINNSNSHRSRQMEHVLVDAFNVKNPQKMKRNHFNVLGGNLNSVMEKLPELYNNGIREILGNPIIGQDNISGHGYWPTNLYQVTNQVGSYADFRKLQLMLFNKGMGWTADGAFVNEGYEGIRIKDIANWGEKSPFINMFETKDLENTQVRFGVFSKNEDVNKHIHIKLVNAPYKIIFEETSDGFKEKAVVRNQVDSSKSTFVQLFDDRLASAEQINGDDFFNVYDKKEATDRFEISSSRDSVQPIHVRVKPSEVELNYAKYIENKKIDDSVNFKNFLTQWSNFSFVNSNKDGGIALWDGNNDISKKRFILSDFALKNMNLSPDKQKEVVSAQYQVQDDTIQVCKFWTGEVSRILTEYVANELGNRIKKTPNLSKSHAYEKAIKDMISENLVGNEASEILEKTDNNLSSLDNLLSKSPVTGKRKYSLKPTVMPENITDGLMSYPLEAIEFSPELTGVFAYPFIKNLAVSEDTVGLSRYDMYKMGDVYYNKIPEQFRNTYKESDKLYATVMTDTATKIMQALSAKTGKKLFNGENLNKEGMEIYSLVASDIAKFLVISALAPDVDFDFQSDMLKFDVKKLQQYDLNKLNLQYETSPQGVAEKLLRKIKTGISSIPNQKIDGFVEHLTKRIDNINSDSINIAKLIIDKTETGLDWRIDAAKDVGDWEAQKANRFDEEKNSKEILSFWKKLNIAVNKYNPNSIKIGEITDWEIPNFKFLDETKFDTKTDYNYFYSTLISLYGQDDNGNHHNDYVSSFNNNLEAFLKSGTLDNLNFTHRFVGNHDKPRILHQLALDIEKFKDDKITPVLDVMKKGLNYSKIYNSLDGNFKKEINDALILLSNGQHTVNGMLKTYDSENFAIRPFDYTIEDIVNEACYKNDDFNNFVKNNPEKINQMKSEILQGIMEPALMKFRSIVLAMVALPGSPTIYAGDELGMTGWETFAKNEKQENRNGLRWDWLKDDNYKFIKEHYDRITALTKVRNMKAASALVNGTLQPLHNQYLHDNNTAVAFYRYNDKTDAITVLHGVGYGGQPQYAGKDAYMSSIKLDGLRSGLKEGTIYVDALNPKSKYKVVNSYEIKALNDEGQPINQINLGNGGLILLRQEDFDGNLLIGEKSENNKQSELESSNTDINDKHVDPQIKLFNTRYNFSYMN